MLFTLHCRLIGLVTRNIVNILRLECNQVSVRVQAKDKVVLNGSQEQVVFFDSHMKSIVVCTHIPGQTYISNQRKLRPFDMLLKINKTKIKDVNHIQEVLVNCTT